MDQRRVPRELKRFALAVVLVSPIVLSVFVRRSIRGGSPLGGFLLVGAAFVALYVVVSYWRLRHRAATAVRRSNGAVIVGTGSYREVFRHLCDWEDYEPVLAWGRDLRSSPSRMAIHIGVSPMRIDFFDAWGPNTGSIKAPEGLDLVVWARGDRVRTLELVYESRSLELDGAGSVSAIRH